MFRTVCRSKFWTRARPVTTWSSLGNAFNTKPEYADINMGFTSKATGLFGIPELRSPEGFHLMKEGAVSSAENLVAEACNPRRSRKMVQIFDELSDSLCRVADLAEFVRVAHPKPKFRHSAEDACVSVSGLVEKLNTDRDLYMALKEVVQRASDVDTLTDVDKHVAQLFLFDFEQCGIHLDEEKRKKVVALNEYILYMGQRFMANCGNPTIVPKQDISEDLRKLFVSEGENVVVTSLHVDHPKELTRKAAYTYYLGFNEQQDKLLEEILTARHYLADICGFPTYAHRAVKGSLAESPENVREFLELLTEELRPRAGRDFQIMAEMKKKHEQNNVLYPWDPPYFASVAKNELLGADSTISSPYFSLGSCMEGLDMLFESLYGINLVPEAALPGEVWSPDVHKIKVVSRSESVLGHIYCDFFERAEKPYQDCHFTIRGGRELSDGSYQNPIVVLHLNFPPPTWNVPSLLSLSMVDNLFHEMGHALHSMTARTTYQHVTGTRCSTDFAEVPSVLMEYFASDPRVVSRFARHYKTGEPIPKDLLKRLCLSKRMFLASEMQLQVFYSMLDQEFHAVHPLGCNTTQVLQRVQEKYYGLPYIANTSWQLRFSHLVGYGAKYYSYLMSRSVASCIWQEYFSNDPFSSLSGSKYRNECLVHGGGKPPRALVGDFLGKEAAPQVLVNSLITELDA